MKSQPEETPVRKYEVKAQADEGEIWIWEEIGEGWFGGISAKQFAKDVKDLGDVKRIHLHINSPGGNVFDAVAMYNLLGQHKAHVVVNIESLAASAATIVAMAGNEIYMADNAMMMIHDAWGLVIGNAAEMRKNADLLDKIDGTIVATYAKRTKIDDQVIKDLMSAETWMTASEALGYGFIDQVTDALEAAASCDLSRFNYRKVPKQFSEKASGCRARLAAMSLKAQRIRIASNPKR